MKLQTVEAHIEEARTKLHVLTEEHDGQFLHPVVIAQSVVLDKLINQYNRLHESNRSKKKPIA